MHVYKVTVLAPKRKNTADLGTASCQDGKSALQGCPSFLSLKSDILCYLILFLFQRPFGYFRFSVLLYKFQNQFDNFYKKKKRALFDFVCYRNESINKFGQNCHDNNINFSSVNRVFVVGVQSLSSVLPFATPQTAA